MEHSTKAGLKNAITCEKFSTPLLDPPNGMVWVKDHYDTHEWILMEVVRQYSLLPFPCVDAIGSCDATTSSAESDKQEVHKNAVDHETTIHHIIEHVILPTDTFLGICLAYKINATKLRQYNRFSGANLALAPRKLLIPVNRSNRRCIKLQDHDRKEFKIYSLLAEVPRLSKRAAEAYLIMADFDLCQAINDAKSDLDWEQSALQEVRPIAFKFERKSKDGNDKLPMRDQRASRMSTVKTISKLGNRKRGDSNDECLEMKSMTAKSLNQKLSPEQSSGYNRSANEGNGCDGNSFSSMPGQIQICSRNREDQPQQMIKALLFDPGLALNNMWLHIISILQQPDDSPRLAEYEMNELYAVHQK